MKPKQKEDIPPNIIGIFNKPLFLYGNLNGEIIPLENPLELQETIEFKQNGKFVELIVLSKPDNPNIPNRNNLIGVWEQQYDNFLDFTGWRLIIADSINDNGVYSIYITKMENNIVTEYKYIYQESGYQEGNPLQTPLVMYGDCTRITFPGIVIKELEKLSKNELKKIFKNDNVWLIDQSPIEQNNISNGSTLYNISKNNIEKKLLTDEFMSNTKNGNTSVVYQKLHWCVPDISNKLAAGCWVGSGQITLFNNISW